jgi:hypothetical protein
LPFEASVTLGVNNMFTGAAWANNMPEHPANAAITTNERMNSPRGRFMTTHDQKREMESKSTSTFLGVDCGKVKPGEPETEDN